MAKTPQTDFTDDLTDPIDDDTGKDVDGIPYCRVHHCRMRVSSGGKAGSKTNYYSCPAPGCKQTAKMIRTIRESVVPDNPVTCSRCSTPKKQVICERDEHNSRGASVVVKCPQCGWKSNVMAAPEFAAQHFERRARNEDRRKKGQYQAAEELGGR